MFCNTYIFFIKNDNDRHFPRCSKTPFSKWYVKDYSESSKYGKIIDALLNKTVDKLHANLKVIAKNILKINNITVNENLKINNDDLNKCNINEPI